MLQLNRSEMASIDSGGVGLFWGLFWGLLCGLLSRS